MPRMSILIACCLLAGCGASREEADLDAVDAELTAANTPDPAITAALHDQIMVDPGLTAQANGDAIRPPAQPYAAPLPAPDVAAGSAAADEALERAPAAQACADCGSGGSLTLAQLAGGGRRRSTCTAAIRYSAGYANRLPAGLPLHPDARVIEAAGADGANCHLRVVSFTLSQPVDRTLDWFYTRARRARFAAEHRVAGDEHVLGGTRGDGAAFVVYASPIERGTAVDLVVDTPG